MAQLSKKELLSMLRFGADRIFAAAEGRPPSDEELDAIIDRSARRAEIEVAVAVAEAGVRRSCITSRFKRGEDF